MSEVRPIWKILGLGFVLAVLAFLVVNVLLPIAKTALTAQPTQVIAVAPTNVPAPTKAPIPGQPTAVTQPTAAQPTQGQPTAPVVKATIPTGPTTVAAATTVVPITCANCPTIQIGGVPYAPYSIWIGASTLAAKYGVNIQYVDLGSFEEYQAEWDANKDPNAQPGTANGYHVPFDMKDDSRFAKMPANTSRALLTTTSTCMLTSGCGIIHFLGQSNGNDLIIVSPQVDTIDDALDVPIIGATFGSVGEFFPKALAWSLMERPIGEFKPLGDAGPAQQFFCANPAYRALSIYNPYATDALKPATCNNRVGNRVLFSSKSFFGIKDILMTNKSVANSVDTEKRALQAYEEFLTLASNAPTKAWAVLSDWSAQSADNATALGYSDYDSWYSDLSGEAMATGKDNGYLFGSQLSVSVQDLTDVKNIMTVYKTFNRQNQQVAPDPNLNTAQMLDGAAVLGLQNNAAFVADINPPNHNLKLSLFAPPGSGRKVLSKLPYLNLQFGNGSDFANIPAATDQLTKLTRALRLMKITLQITAAGDDLAANRADRVKSELVRNPALRVPDGKISMATNNNLPPGKVQFALIGTEE